MTAGREAVYGYDALEFMTSARDMAENVLYQDYDRAGNVTSLTDAMGGTTRYEYDSMNRVIKRTDAMRQTSAYSYNAAGVLDTVTAPHGSVIHYTYDQSGRLTKRTDGQGSTTYIYDHYSNLVEEENALGHVTRHAYSAEGNLIQKTWMTEGNSVILMIAQEI